MRTKCDPYLLIVLRLRLAGEVFTCVIAVYNVFHEISEVQNLQHPLRMLRGNLSGSISTMCRRARTSVYALVSPQRRQTAGLKSSRSFFVFGSGLSMSSSGMDESHFASKSRASRNRPNRVHVVSTMDEGKLGRKGNAPILWCLISPRIASPYSR